VATGQERGPVEIRHLTTLPELGEAVRLQKEIWGFEDIELLPLRLFVVAQKVGGQTVGAFDQGRMVGFLLAIPGLKQGQMYLHSHMMGVRPEYRNSGLGRRMKLLQREDALSRGIQLIEWTFDPLEIKNAYFNIERLGAVVRRYVLNQYGTTTSHLHGGLPTDRCVAEWYIAGDRAAAVVAGRTKPAADVVARISVPANIAELRATDPRAAREVQAEVSAAFLAHFAANLAVIGFEISPEAGTYLLGPWNSK
jgi:predicted GNAT superfamily acetyltransferase